MQSGEIDRLDPEVVDSELDRRGYMVVRDEQFAKLAETARGEYIQSLARTRPHSPEEKFHYSSLAQEPWRKMAIGSKNGVGESYAQILQTTYFSEEDRSCPALSSVFRRLVEVRNLLMRIGMDFGRDPERDRFWNACRIHHYPRGGGFMLMHKDTYFPKKLEGKPFYQVATLLSRKGVDFERGGGFVIGSDGKKVDLEVEAGFGSLVLFDGRVFHGVDDVDLDQVIDFSRPDGRIAAFANLYVVP